MRVYDWIASALSKAVSRGSGACRISTDSRGQRCHDEEGLFTNEAGAVAPSSESDKQENRTEQAARRHAQGETTSKGRRVSSDASRLAEKDLLQSGVFIRSTLPVRGKPIFKQTSALLDPNLLNNPEKFADVYCDVISNLQMTEQFSTGLEGKTVEGGWKRSGLAPILIRPIVELMKKPVTSGSERHQNIMLAEKVINDHAFQMYANHFGRDLGLTGAVYKEVSDFFAARVGDAGINQTAHEIAAQFGGSVSAGDIVGAIHNARGVFGNSRVSYGDTDGIDAAVCIGLLFGLSEYVSKASDTNRIAMEIDELKYDLGPTQAKNVDLITNKIFTDGLKEKLLQRHACMWTDKENDAFRHGLTDALLKSGLSPQNADEITDFTVSSLAQGDAIDTVLKMATWSSLHALKNPTDVWDSSRRTQEGIKTTAPGVESTHDAYYEDALNKCWSLAKSVRAVDRRGINTTMVCSFGGDKPFDAIMKMSNSGFGTSANERLAYEVDKVLGLDVVPPTACVGPFSIQLHVGTLVEGGSLMSAGRLRITNKTDYQLALDRPDNEWLQRINAFDFIMANTDRHRGNVFMHNKNRFFAIDNGALNGVRCVDRGIYRRVEDRPISKKLLNKLDGVDTSRFYRTLIRGGFLPDDANKCIVRLNQLRLSGMFPTVPLADDNPTDSGESASSAQTPTRPPLRSTASTR